MHLAVSAKATDELTATHAATGSAPVDRTAPATGVSGYDYLLLFVGTTSAAIILLLTASLFSPLRALALGLLLALPGAVLLRDKDDRRSLFTRADPWLVGYLLLALFLRANFSTNYIGGQDPGAYVNFSAIIEHFGGLYFPDTFRDTLPVDLKQLYDRTSMAYTAVIVPLGDGLRYQVGFYPLHPGWMAVFWGLFGADLHGLAVLVFSLLGVTGAYFLTLELAGSDGRSAARLAALLIAVNPVLCFFAKFPLSETQTAALLLNAGYLLAKALRVDGRRQLFLLASSLLLLLAYFFTRLSFPILVVPWAALYVLSCSQRLDRSTALRLLAYLWLLVPAGVVAAIFYYVMLPRTFEGTFDLYQSMFYEHDSVAAVAIVVVAGLAALAVPPIRNRLRPWLEFGMSVVERVAPWLPLLIVLASIPSVLKLIETGELFLGNVTPEPTSFRYHAIYRWILAITPFLWCLLLALPGLIKRQSALTIPLLFLGATLALTEVWAPSLPYLYYHVRYLASEVIPLSLVIIAIALAMMWRAAGRRRALAMVAVLPAIVVMGAFSAVELRGKEGENSQFFHELDQAVGENDVLIMDGGDAWLATPIRYSFNKQVFIAPDKATPEQLRQIVSYLLEHSGSKYGRILQLSGGRLFRLPLSRTVEGLLTYTESVVTNSEHWRSGGWYSQNPGHMFLPYKWYTRGAAFTLFRVNAIPPLDYRLSLGCPIDFSQTGNSTSYIEEGWSVQEDAFRWTDGPVAGLRVRLGRPPNAAATDQILLDFRATPFGASQRLIVAIDGKQVSELELKVDKSDYEIDVNLEKPDADVEHEIVFKLPDAHSPKSVGLSEDARQLGMAMRSLTFFDSARTPGKCQ